MSTALALHRLADLIGGLRAADEVRADWVDTAQLVAEELRVHLPGPDVLTADQRSGSLDNHGSHTLHVEPDGSFSIVALVWRTGQSSRIHDHVTWCALLIGRRDTQVGPTSGRAPPEDIHRVGNTGEATAIAIHIYGTDTTRIGSARRYYNRPGRDRTGSRDVGGPCDSKSAGEQSRPTWHT